MIERRLCLLLNFISTHTVHISEAELFGLVTTSRKCTWHTSVIKVGVLYKEGDIIREMWSPVGQSLMEARGTEMKDQS